MSKGEDSAAEVVMGIICIGAFEPAPRITVRLRGGALTGSPNRNAVSSRVNSVQWGLQNVTATAGVNRPT